ncbi:hypothetical protein [Microbacterium trichothecenolyticum]|uniref:hypothetical protein n=1 Tax=Microbacterium trichothecenolyticum TaxID=69370 RepID=UPI0027D7BC74|nr:hypothetical protein [Microbacterium trichothecenolyticum]
MAALFGIALAASVASGCSQMPFHDDSYKTEIPAVLEAADLGITDAWAGVSLSGFTETLSIGGTVQLPPNESTEATPEFVRDVIGVALNGRSMSMSYLDLAFRDAEDESVDVASALTSLGATPGYDGTSITMDEARKIAEESGR